MSFLTAFLAGVIIGATAYNYGHTTLDAINLGGLMFIVHVFGLIEGELNNK